MFCARCGRQVGADDAFCVACGSPVRSSGATAPPNHLVPSASANDSNAAERAVSGLPGHALAVRRRSRTGVNVALGIVAGVLLIVFLFCIWAASAAQQNLNNWTGPAQGAPNPGEFETLAVISIVGFVVLLAIVIVRLVQKRPVAP